MIYLFNKKRMNCIPNPYPYPNPRPCPPWRPYPDPLTRPYDIACP